MTAEGRSRSKIQYGYERCPTCKMNLDGGMIPVERRGLYYGAERYSKLIRYPAISSDHADRLKCPFCKKEFYT